MIFSGILNVVPLDSAFSRQFTRVYLQLDSASFSMSVNKQNIQMNMNIKMPKPKHSTLQENSQLNKIRL